MLPEVVAALACPHDQGALELEERALGCARGHRFDLARQGYATLAARPLAHRGDDAVMVERRQRVHAAGALGAVHDAVVAAAATATGTGDRPSIASSDEPSSAHPKEWHARRAAGLVCDLGAGPGTYLAAVLDHLPDHFGLALDVSRVATRRAARCHPRASAVVADVWAPLPLRTGSVALLLDIFAPRNVAEFARVVRPGGAAVVVTPEVDHLAELRSTLDLLDVPSGKAEQVAHDLEPGFRLVATTRVREQVRVPVDLAADLAWMGPSGHHLGSIATPVPVDGCEPHTSPDGAVAGTIAVTIAATVSRLERSPDT